ncbi:hypothetical protein A2U01_0033222 [Trifolium medium]|uniref:Uncharacterized protein n=1 Tax=Trifolium medium TaxID=97028 RepID=A0A392PKT8_9FABA|nr:hypothetical protein [Trifolium medium]
MSALETLKQEKTRLESDVGALQASVAAQYEDIFNYALEQVKLLFPDLDEKRLSEADALNQMVDGKLVPFTLLGGK